MRSKTLFEINWDRRQAGKPQIPTNGTGNDIAKAIIYLAECVLSVGDSGFKEIIDPLKSAPVAPKKGGMKE